MPCCRASLCCHEHSGVGERGQGRSAAHLCKAISNCTETCSYVSVSCVVTEAFALFRCSHTRPRCILQTLCDEMRTAGPGLNATFQLSPMRRAGNTWTAQKRIISYKNIYSAFGGYLCCPVVPFLLVCPAPSTDKQSAHIPLKQDESIVCKQAAGASLRSSGHAVVAACIERSSAKSCNVFKLAHFA